MKAAATPNTYRVIIERIVCMNGCRMLSNPFSSPGRMQVSMSRCKNTVWTTEAAAAMMMQMITVIMYTR